MAISNWQIRLFLQLDAEEWQTLDVVGMSYEAAMNGPYKAILTVCSNTMSIAAMDNGNHFLEKLSRVEVTEIATGELFCIWGLVTKVQLMTGVATAQQLVMMTLEPENSVQWLNQRTGAFYGATLPDVVDTLAIQVPQREQFAQYLSFKNQLDRQNQNAYPIHPLQTQYLESDLDFLSRQCRRHGAWYCFTQGKAGTTLIFGDQDDQFLKMSDRAIPILLEVGPNPRGIYDLEISMGHVVNEAISGRYYDEYTGNTMRYTQPIEAKRTWGVTHFVTPFIQLTDSQFQTQLKRLAEGELAHQYPIDGHFSGYWFEPGKIIRLDDNDWECHNDYLITYVKYDFFQADKNKALGGNFSENHYFKAVQLKENQNYRPRGLKQYYQREPMYKGCMIGVKTYTKDGDMTVMPDEIGRIPILFPYNYSYFFNGYVARYAKLIMESNHKDAGISYPFYKDTEICVEFDRGQTDKPYILGALANDQTGHLMSDTRQKRSQVRLPQGQSLTYSNMPGDQNFLILNSIHQEGDHQTFMLFNNFPSQTRPGEKHLDHLVHTTASYTQLATEGLHHQLGGGNATQKGTAKINKPDGLQTIEVIPAWRKDYPRHVDSANYEESIAYFSYQLQLLKNAVEGQAVMHPLDIDSHQGQCILESNNDISSLNALLRLSSEFGAKVLTQLATLDFDDPQCAHLPFSNDWAQLLQNHAASLALQDPKKQSELAWLSQLKDLAQANLQLDNPPPLREGFLYVLCQCNSGPSDNPYQSWTLFREYKVIASNKANTFIPIDLAKWAGFDERPAEEESDAKGFIELPCQYLENGQYQGSFNVQVFYAGQQLSWPRLNRLGPVKADDPRLAGNDASDPKNQLELVAAYGRDETLAQKRCGSPLDPQQLIAIYNQQQHAKKITPIDPQGTHTLSAWQNTSLYFIQDCLTHKRPYLLVSDPVGIMVQANLIIKLCQSLILQNLSALKTDQSMKTAALAYQFFYHINANGLWDTKLLNLPDGTKSKGDILKSIIAAQRDFNPQKLQRALKIQARLFLKTLLAYYQVTLDNLLNTKAQGPFAVDPIVCIEEVFASRGQAYDQAYGLWKALTDGLNVTPYALDLPVSPELLPVNQVTDVSEYKTETVIVDTEPMNIRTLVAEKTQTITYTLQKHKITQTTKIFDANGKILTSQSNPVGTLPVPPGIKLLTKLLSGEHRLSPIIFPTEKALSQPIEDDHAWLQRILQADKVPAQADDDYIQGQATYHPDARAQARGLLIQSAFAQEATARQADTDDSLEKGLKIAESVIDHADSYATTVINQLHQSEAVETIPHAKKVAQLITDGLSLPPAAFSFSPSSEYEFAGSYLLKSGYQLADNHLQQFTDHIFDNNLQSSQFVLPYNTQVTYQNLDVASQAYLKDAKRALTAFPEKLTDYAKNPQNGFTTYLQKSLSHGRLLSSIGVNAFAGFEVYQALQDEQDQPSFFHSLYLLLQAGNMANTLKESIESTCKLLGKSEAYEKVMGHKFIELLTEERWLNESISFLGAMSLATTLTDTVTQTAKWYQDLGKNNPAIAYSDVLGMIGDMALVGAATKKVIETAAKKTTEGAIGEKVEDVGIKKVSESIALNESKIAGFLFTDLIPGIDVISILITLCQVASFILSFFKTNKYQDWVRASQFGNGDNKFTNGTFEWLALVELLAQPRITVGKGFKNQEYVVTVNTLALPILPDDLTVRTKDQIGFSGSWLPNRSNDGQGVTALASIKNKAWQRDSYFVGNLQKMGIRYAIDMLPVLPEAITRLTDDTVADKIENPGVADKLQLKLSADKYISSLKQEYGNEITDKLKATHKPLLYTMVRLDYLANGLRISIPDQSLYPFEPDQPNTDMDEQTVSLYYQSRQWYVHYQSIALTDEDLMKVKREVDAMFKDQKQDFLLQEYRLWPMKPDSGSGEV